MERHKGFITADPILVRYLETKSTFHQLGGTHSTTATRDQDFQMDSSEDPIQPFGAFLRILEHFISVFASFQKRLAKTVGIFNPFLRFVVLLGIFSSSSFLSYCCLEK